MLDSMFHDGLSSSRTLLQLKMLLSTLFLFVFDLCLLRIESLRRVANGDRRSDRSGDAGRERRGVPSFSVTSHPPFVSVFYRTNACLVFRASESLSRSLFSFPSTSRRPRRFLLRIFVCTRGRFVAFSSTRVSSWREQRTSRTFWVSRTSDDFSEKHEVSWRRTTLMGVGWTGSYRRPRGGHRPTAPPKAGVADLRSQTGFELGAANPFI